VTFSPSKKGGKDPAA
jgi:hypothetical protein